MPRAFDSDAARHLPTALRFTENVDCPICDTTFEGVFHDDSDTVEDMTDAPVGSHTCPSCHHEWISGMSGWTFFSEAG